MPRTSSLHALVALAALAATAWAATDVRAENYTFRSRRAAGTVDQVKTTLEVSGELVVNAGEKPNRLKTQVTANLGYAERSLAAAGDGPLRAVRYYDDAAAKIQIEKEGFKPALSDPRRLIGVEVDGRATTLFSPSGPLTREELDLIDLQGSSLLFDRLLPDKPVAIGDKWQLSDDLLTNLLRLDTVGSTEVVATLTSVQNGGAIMELAGQISGAINGVSTEIELKGKYRFNQPAGRVDWAAFLIREKRSIGHVGPGLEVVARLQTLITPGASSDKLSDAALRGLPLEPKPELTQLVQKSADGQWQFTYDRRWYITTDTKEQLVMRMVDRGELVAQCNIASLAKVPQDKLATLPQFQQDIQKALGENFGRFIKAAQNNTESHYRVYRVEAQGEVEKLPIEWIYRLVADEQGRQVTLVFTVESELMDEFGQADEPLVQSLRFLESNVAMRVKAAPSTPQLRMTVR